MPDKSSRLGILTSKIGVAEIIPTARLQPNETARSAAHTIHLDQRIDLIQSRTT
jgi:hypothetical protein